MLRENVHLLLEIDGPTLSSNLLSIIRAEVLEDPSERETGLILRVDYQLPPEAILPLLRAARAKEPGTLFLRYKLRVVTSSSAIIIKSQVEQNETVFLNATAIRGVELV